MGRLLQTPPLNARVSVEEEAERFYEAAVAGDSKDTVSSRHDRTDPRVAQPVAAPTNLHRLKPDKIPALRREGDMKSHPNQEGICN